MIELGLRHTSHPTKTDLEKSRVRAVRARELLANEHFQWWRGLVEDGLQKMRNTLVRTDLKGVQTAKLRGKILGVMQILRELEFMAANLEEVEKRLADREFQEHEQRYY